MNEQDLDDFHTAFGEELSWAISPPVPAEDAIPHECMEALWDVLGEEATPLTLASISDEQVAELSNVLTATFDAGPIAEAAIRDAVAATLRRWPVEDWRD